MFFLISQGKSAIFPKYTVIVPVLSELFLHIIIIIFFLLNLNGINVQMSFTFFFIKKIFVLKMIENTVANRAGNRRERLSRRIKVVL